MNTKICANNYVEQLIYTVKQAATKRGQHQYLINYAEALNISITNHTLLVNPLYGSMAVNFFCNSHCTYCNIWQREREAISLSDLLLAVDELCKLGVFIISLTGGEPALFPQLPALIAYIRSRDVFVQTMTNGSLLRKKILTAVIEAGLNALVLSLDTLDNKRYHMLRGMPLEPVLQGVNDLLSFRSEKSFPLLAVNCVISKTNLADIIPLVRWCSERGVSIGFQPLHSNFDSRGQHSLLNFQPEDEYQLICLIEDLVKMKQEGYLVNNDEQYLDAIPQYLVYRKLPETFVCKTGYTAVVLDQNQNVKTCWSMPAVGNLKTQQIADIWQSEDCQQSRFRMLSLDCPKCWSRAHTELQVERWFGGLSRNG